VDRSFSNGHEEAIISSTATLVSSHNSIST